MITTVIGLIVKHSFTIIYLSLRPARDIEVLTSQINQYRMLR